MDGKYRKLLLLGNVILGLMALSAKAAGTKPAISTQPAATLNAAVGTSPSLNVTATGTAPLAYQWRKDGALIPHATNSALLLPSAQPPQSGSYTVVVSNNAGTATSAAANVQIGLPPVIATQPLPTHGLLYDQAEFRTTVTGSAPLSYQWRRNGAPITGATGNPLQLNAVLPTSAGNYSVVVSNPFGTVTSAAAGLNVIGITDQPQSQAVAPGANVTLTCGVLGNPAPACQWYLQGGYPIPGATNATLSLTNVTVAEGGWYYLAANYGPTLASVESDWAQLVVAVPALPWADLFANRGAITGLSGSGSGNNFNATTETGEPSTYAYKAKNSVWVKWTAPANGVVVLSSAGSDFDTILGVFRGNAVNNLSLVVADDDSGGYLNSKVVFSALAGVEYNIVVAGFAGAAGQIGFTWNLTPSDIVLPVITSPASRAAVLGSPVTLSVSYVGHSAPVSVQWLFEGQPITDATNETYSLPSLQLAQLGVYQARLVTGPFTLHTRPADVQINTEGIQHVLAQNRQPDADQSGLNGGNSGPTAGLRRRITSVSGYSGTQIFATRAGKDPAEPNHCGVVGGSSYWLSYAPPATGTVVLNTSGSSYDTILAVYTDDGLGNGYASLIPVACNDNVSSTDLTSRVSFTGTLGVTYYIVVDGKNGAYGTAYLDYRVTAPPTISTLSAVTIAEDTTTGARAFTVGDAETPAASLVVTATSSNPAIVPVSGLVLGGSGASRTVNVTPAANKNGSVTITLTVTDADGAATSSAFVVTVTPVNDAPVAGTDTMYRLVNLSTKVLISTLLANDTDVDGNPRTLTAVASLSFLGAQITKDATYVYYTARVGYNTPDYFTYTLSDGQGGTATGRVNVYVQ